MALLRVKGETNWRNMSREYDFPLKTEQQEEEDEGEHGDLVLCQQYGVV